MKRGALLGTLLATLLAYPLTACHSSGETGSSCADMTGTCDDGWDLTLRTTAPGTYVVTSTFAGQASSVTCTLPGTTCTASDERVHASLDAMGIELGTTHSPQTIQVVVTRDGAMVLSQSFSPAYEAYYPNGEDCPLTCAGAADVTDIP